MMGWMQYEATPSYMSAMYDPAEGYSTSAGLPNMGEEEELEETDDEEILLPEEKKDYTVLITGLISAAVIGVLLMILTLLLRRGGRFAASRQRLIESARDREAYFGGERDNRAVAKELNDCILGVFAALGMPPRRGELSAAYAARITEAYGALAPQPLEEILTLIAKEEFGDGLRPEEMAHLADYLEEMSREVYSGLSLPRRFWLRCIRCAV
jgi:hypothetical protein